MKDLIVDAIGALIISIIGYIILKRHKNNVDGNIASKGKENS
jgi:hypothetical protein